MNIKRMIEEDNRIGNFINENSYPMLNRIMLI